MNNEPLSNKAIFLTIFIPASAICLWLLISATNSYLAGELDGVQMLFGLIIYGTIPFILGIRLVIEMFIFRKVTRKVSKFFD